MKLLQENEHLNNRVVYLENRIEELEDLIAELEVQLSEAYSFDLTEVTE